MDEGDSGRYIGSEYLMSVIGTVHRPGCECGQVEQVVTSWILTSYALGATNPEQAAAMAAITIAN